MASCVHDAACQRLHTYTHTPVARREADEGFFKRPGWGARKEPRHTQILYPSSFCRPESLLDVCPKGYGANDAFRLRFQAASVERIIWFGSKSVRYRSTHLGNPTDDFSLTGYTQAAKLKESRGGVSLSFLWEDRSTKSVAFSELSGEFGAGSHRRSNDSDSEDSSSDDDGFGEGGFQSHSTRLRRAPTSDIRHRHNTSGKQKEEAVWEDDEALYLQDLEAQREQLSVRLREGEKGGGDGGGGGSERDALSPAS